MNYKEHCTIALEWSSDDITQEKSEIYDLSKVVREVWMEYATELVIPFPFSNLRYEHDFSDTETIPTGHKGGVTSHS